MINVTPFEKFPDLATKRLRLRQLTMEDAADIFKIYSDPQVMRYSLEQPYATITSARILIRFFMDEYQRRTLIWWGMEHHRDQRIIGSLGLWNLNRQHLTAELGFDTASAYWRKGYTFEAAQVVMHYGFERLQLRRIYAKTLLENEPSMSLLEKAGFVRKGELEPHSPLNEKKVPVSCYELNREDFDAN